MTNNEFVAIVATKIGENKARTSDIIKKITEAISEELVKGNEIKLNQFGKFSTVRVKSRN
jgi:nucleoid DNA-binding protein